ncbi:bZIP transcription factor 12-like [Typha latifolia]|uniref:bZIP transcription factor 12-like n=1 Tax=Typha latifolia TaxID=4733 RepID=UPI003C2CDF1A
MASSGMAATSSSATSDLPRQPSIYSLTIGEIMGDPVKNLGSMSMDDLIRNVYAEEGPPAYGSGEGDAAEEAAPELSRQGSFLLPKGMGSMTVEEVWREISGGKRASGVDDGGGERSGYTEAVLAANGEVTLEDFLTRAGAVREEEVRVPPGSMPGGFGVDPMSGQQMSLENPILTFGNGVESGGGGRGGRGRKRTVLDPEDRVALQRQKRMIKNRESAARSRERKQAYTVELESLVTQLEEENNALQREQDELLKLRFKQLMEKRIPVTEKNEPRRALRRSKSLEW